MNNQIELQQRLREIYSSKVYNHLPINTWSSIFLSTHIIEKYSENGITDIKGVLLAMIETIDEYEKQKKQ